MEQQGMPANKVPAAHVREQIVSILGAWGMAPVQVAITANVMVETDLWGVDSHGVSMLMMYETMMREGRLNVHAQPQVLDRSAVTARIDGDAGLGHPVAWQGMELAVEMALAAGLGAVSVFNSHHFGAAGVYAKIASDRGCVGLVTSTSRTVAVLPTFGAEPVLGTNPIAIAAPATRNRPFLLDIATSAVALNKVKVYDFYGKPIPAGWVSDGEGTPVTDAAQAMAICRASLSGGLNPVGGTRELGSHKGYGLGVVAQILAGAMAGGSFSPLRDRDLAPDQPYNIGHFFLAINPAFFRPGGEFGDEVDDVIDVLHGTRPANPDQPVLVAGDPEAATKAQRERDGIPIPPALATSVRAIAERAGVPFTLE
jgi:LDH2 family malate/lactate/ureidoglycolate dehydrogenase